MASSCDVLLGRDPCTDEATWSCEVQVSEHGHYREMLLCDRHSNLPSLIVAVPGSRVRVRRHRRLSTA